jgi:elongation factor G
MEQATADPSTLSQETIVENLDPLEAKRLSRVRNIGIAVRRTPAGDMRSPG